LKTFKAPRSEASSGREYLHAASANCAAPVLPNPQIVQADGKIQIVDHSGKVCAELVPVPGPKGDPGIEGPQGPKGDSIVGPKGEAGVSPDVDEIVAGIVKQIGTRLAN
jgi:hypothetical protein